MLSRNSTSGIAVGIDFGTTNSSVARRTSTGVALVQFSNNTASSRSILYLEKAQRESFQAPDPRPSSTTLRRIARATAPDVSSNRSSPTWRRQACPAPRSSVAITRFKTLSLAFCTISGYAPSHSLASLSPPRPSDVPSGLSVPKRPRTRSLRWQDSEPRSSKPVSNT